MFYVVPVTRIGGHKVPRGVPGRWGGFDLRTASNQDARIFARARARRYDFSFIAHAWVITKKSNYFRRARALVRASFPVNIYFRSRKRHLSLACPSRVGKPNTRRMIHEVIENFVRRVHDCVESRVRDGVLMTTSSKLPKIFSWPCLNVAYELLIKKNNLNIKRENINANILMLILRKISKGELFKQIDNIQFQNRVI